MAEFPELAHLSREELEDLLSDPIYFQAVFHSLGRVKALYQSQAELGLANEAIASTYVLISPQFHFLLMIPFQRTTLVYKMSCINYGQILKMHSMMRKR